ncbi:hypothetical protein [Nonomuraea typhae]|uniref:Nucleoside phosphorylase domain-containing protein n=1 Tax=Nonomuraea typhae TaxID=2603600 RepID=A0ABW7ZAY1_9ACTN
MNAAPQIALITALPVESFALRRTLGPVSRVNPPGDDPNDYYLAQVECGPVVVTSLVETNVVAAADASANLVRSFPSVRAAVLCGHAAGVPRPEDPERDVRLGDIVVGDSGVINHSHRRVTEDGVKLRGDPLPASALLRRAVVAMRSLELGGEEPWRSLMSPLPSLAYRRPDPEDDKDRPTKVFYGRIGSGEELLRSAARRDELARPNDLLAIEMEAAGVAGSLALAGRECLVVRGIADYGSKDKTDTWQPYAALAAAAYVRALLRLLKPPSAGGRHHFQELVVVMGQVPSLQSPRDRDVVLDLMGPPVCGAAARDERTTVALVNLAKACMGYRQGFEDLLRALTMLEGESLPVVALAEMVRRLQ